MDEKGTIKKAADMDLMCKEIFSVSISDQQTRETIRKTWRDYHVLLEPHGAVGWAGLTEYLDQHPAENRKEQLFVALETAHPAKFPDEIQRLLGLDPPLPKSLEGLDKNPEIVMVMPLDYHEFKNYLMRMF
jgi:threonine synthase